MNPKVGYLLSSLKKRSRLQGNSCPSCGFTEAKVVARKFLVTDLRRCEKCYLLFRTPTTTAEENFTFYQETYQQGFTTAFPDDEQLQELLNQHFSGTSKDYSTYLRILEALDARSGQHLLDYGCSWGYGSWQFQEAGYQVTGFEISKSRCQFAREKLGIDAKDSLTEIQGQFDIIFSSHVIEHLPSVSQYLNFTIEHLKPGGLLIMICPNGCEEFRLSQPKSYYQSWGFVHPQLLDDKFYLNYFNFSNLLITSDLKNYQPIANWDRKSTCCTKLDKAELLAIWSKPVCNFN